MLGVEANKKRKKISTLLMRVVEKIDAQLIGIPKSL